MDDMKNIYKVFRGLKIQLLF
uniref:Uncharacterized protein n=1 Tax=Vitis vinifera TaxID=29760 RepID=F6I2L5_VITVI